MSKNPEDKTGPSGALSLPAKPGPLDLYEAQSYCRREAEGLIHRQNWLVAQGHRKAPDAGILKLALLYHQMATFFEHAAPLRDPIRALMTEAIKRRKADEAEALALLRNKNKGEADDES